MRVFSALSVVIGLALSGRAAAVDLTRIGRSLRKEPAYQSKAPQYCLLVFGPQAKVRVWLVLDGDALYLDRNGNGDLTDPGERLVPEYALHRSEKRPDAEVLRSFNCKRPAKFPHETDDEPILSARPDVFWFHVFHFLPREDYLDQDFFKRQKEKPFYVALASRTGYAQLSRVAFADRPEAAPILHFDGPLRLALDDKGGPLELRRGAKGRALAGRRPRLVRRSARHGPGTALLALSGAGRRATSPASGGCPGQALRSRSPTTPSPCPAQAACPRPAGPAADLRYWLLP